ncbi:MAG: M3 family oligoendopeptidase [Anaerolineales bacterium]|jgi:oligoendopeptidase F
MSEITPRWDLSNVYPGLDHPEFENAMQQFGLQIASLEELFTRHISPTGAETEIAVLADLVSEVISALNSAHQLGSTLRAYIFTFITTDSRDDLAKRRWSEFEQVYVRLQKLDTQNQAWIGKISPQLEAVIASNPVAEGHAFFLRTAAEQSRYLMSEVEENLAVDLQPSGASAWSRLQGTLTSQLTIDFELDGETKKMPLPALINLHSHANEDVRRRAYEAELTGLETLAEPLAACLNGVKGAATVLNQRRGRQDALHSAIDDARIDRPTLEAMLAAMQASFPVFRKYLKTKAHRLGKEKLPWWDLYAPLGTSATAYSYAEARDFIVDHFANFTLDLADFTKQAFEERWIDAEQRDGKRGGAFCIGLPAVKESRILCNFDGSLDQVSTIAHELGHAYHNHCAYRAGKTMLQKATPMTLAETASILCETVVMQAVLNETKDPQEELSILETRLIGDTQVIVDIYSRYLFEKEVFECREKSELSAADLCDIMQRAQLATYGDVLDERYLHKYMWTWKPHYYRPELSFYNFPYAFGLLFGNGLYAIYQQRGAEFIPEYQQLLATTGEGKAADLAERFGIDIRQSQFWEDSLAVIARRIERYCELR